MCPFGTLSINYTYDITPVYRSYPQSKNYYLCYNAFMRLHATQFSLDEFLTITELNFELGYREGLMRTMIKRIINKINYIPNTHPIWAILSDFNQPVK